MDHGILCPLNVSNVPKGLLSPFHRPLSLPRVTAINSLMLCEAKGLMLLQLDNLELKCHPWGVKVKLFNLYEVSSYV